jgi:ABC-type multidrug transport system fused ATPase/permease subunit
MFPAEVQAMVSFMRDSSMTGQRLKRGSVRRMLSYARPYRRQVSIYLAMTVLSAGMLTAIPVLLQTIIDHGILRRDTAVVLWTAGVVAGLFTRTQTGSLVSGFSDHVQRQSVQPVTSGPQFG